MLKAAMALAFAPGLAMQPAGVDVDAVLEKVRVEFALEPKLQVMVPVEMREDFGVANTLYGGTGVAKYSNYRRFQTSARIVPPPP